VFLITGFRLGPIPFKTGLVCKRSAVHRRKCYYITDEK
jgi:hypothetical protein